jgi:Ca2+-binding RTX toxin-like protein
VITLVRNGETDRVTGVETFQFGDGARSLAELGAIVEGTAAADSLTGDANPNAFEGGAGDDLLAGAGGSDTLIGGEGDDRLYGFLNNASNPGPAERRPRLARRRRGQ